MKATTNQEKVLQLKSVLSTIKELEVKATDTNIDYLYGIKSVLGNMIKDLYMEIEMDSQANMAEEERGE